MTDSRLPAGGRPLLPPTFTSAEEYSAHLSDISFWRPYVAEILSRYGLANSESTLLAGIGGTYPTFICGDIVVKLFGFVSAWRQSHATEHAAHVLLATDSGIAAPRLLSNGYLFEDDSAPWPYLITTRMSGVAWADARLTAAERVRIAADLGRQMRRVHALNPAGVVTQLAWRELNVTAAAARSSLPSHLIAQVGDYVAHLRPFDEVFVHADLVANHVFVADGRLAGIIDWGDAIVTDRHYEIIQVYRDLFSCDRVLLRVFLEACDWPVGADFARQALGLALYRQAAGLMQHLTMDVFEPIAAAFPLQDIATLAELATVLFAI